MQNLKIKFTNVAFVITHILIGIIFFYFIVHPVIMTMYWFEVNEEVVNFNILSEVFVKNLRMAFTVDMVGMASIFIALGTITGLLFSFLTIGIRKKSRIIELQQDTILEGVISLIEIGENNTMEFKSSLRYDYVKETPNSNLESVIVKTIAGFLNAQGGRLIIGVDDDGHILGLKCDYNSLKKKDKDGFELKLYQLISNDIGRDKCHLIKISFFQIDDNEICLLEIKKSKTPVYVMKKGETTFYVRIGNATKPLSVKETVNYLNR
ncbi:MAG: AAA family ATPase [Bacteroidetes bacterium]|nr:MAG: AAA family ATPase [Bacteroidota bacterium]